MTEVVCRGNHSKAYLLLALGGDPVVGFSGIALAAHVVVLAV